jgi:ABC-type phosphate transport system auxiliary subunit
MPPSDRRELATMAGTQESMLNSAVDAFKQAQMRLNAAKRATTSSAAQAEFKAAKTAYEAAERSMKSKHDAYTRDMKDKALSLSDYCQGRGVSY